MRARTEQLSALLRDPELRYEALSALCELGRLGDERLQELCATLAQEEPDALTGAVLRAVARGQGQGQGQRARRLSMTVEEALGMVEQLEALLLDMWLLLPLRRDLRPPERLRREALIKSTRARARRARGARDEEALTTLAEASRRLGDLALRSPERWYDEGVGLLLGALAGGEELTLDVPRLSVEEVVGASRHPALLGAMRRGVEGADEALGEALGEAWCRARLAGRVEEEALEAAARVAGRAAWREERRAGGARFELVYCPPGALWMGSPGGVAPGDHLPRRRVTLTRGFWLGQTQVTQGLWEGVMGANPSRFRGAARPVEQVSWFDCVRFCNALSALEGLPPAYALGGGDAPAVWLDPNARGYRLPTEAEWEYAARAGGEHVYAGGDDLAAVGWHARNAEGQTRAVGQRLPNAWGLYDMSGNVWEWCVDGGAPRDPQLSAPVDFIDPLNDEPEAATRVERGGSWRDGAGLCGVACRFSRAPRARDATLGLRLARSFETAV